MLAKAGMGYLFVVTPGRLAERLVRSIVWAYSPERGRRIPRASARKTPFGGAYGKVLVSSPFGGGALPA